MPNIIPQTRPRVVGTPPLNPASQPNYNVERLLQEIMNPEPQPTFGAADSGLLGDVFQAIAAGVGTGFSSNPGDALLDQVKQLQQRKFVADQNEKDRKDKQRQIREQFGYQVIRDNLGEEADIRKEKRVNLYQQDKEKRDLETFRQQQNIELMGKKDFENFRTDQAKRVAEFEAQMNSRRDATQHVYQTERDELQKRDARMLNRIKLTEELTLYGVDFETADSISKKRLNDEKLTETESKALGKAHRLMSRFELGERQAKLNAINRSNRSGGGGGESAFAQQMKMKLMSDAALNDWVITKPAVKDENGNIVEPALMVESNRAPKDQFGNVMGTPASRAEAVQHMQDYVLPAVLGGRQAKLEATAKMPTELQYNADWDNKFKIYRERGMTDAEIIQDVGAYMSDRPGMSKAEKEAINNSVLRKLKEPKPRVKEGGVIDLLNKVTGKYQSPTVDERTEREKRIREQRKQTRNTVSGTGPIAPPSGTTVPRY